MTPAGRRPCVIGALLLASCGGGAPARPAAGGAGATTSASPPSRVGGDTATSEPPTAAGPLRDPVRLTATVDVEGARHTYAGLGECHHTTEASIYEVPAAMWSARVDSRSRDLPYLNLTLWQPKSGSQVQVTLGLMAGGRTHEIATVTGSDLRGSGTGRVEPSGTGGALHVEGKDAEGRSVRVVVECSRFTEPVAEGG